MIRVGRHEKSALQGVSYFSKFPDGHDYHEPDKTKMSYLAFFVGGIKQEKWIYKKIT